MIDRPGSPTGESFFARAWDVLFAPGRGFEAVARRPRTLWQPLLLLALVNGIAIGAFYDRLVVPEQMRAIEARGLGEAEAAEAEKIFLSPWTRIATVGIAVLGVPAAALIVAVVAHLGAGYLLGGAGTFFGSWAAVSYALLVGIVEWVAKLPVMLAQNRLEVFFGPALFLADGWRVDLVDVVDRPRRHGTSKYGNLDRLLVGIPDLFGVAWIARRRRKSGRFILPGGNAGDPE